MIPDAAVEALCEARHPAWSMIQPESRRKLRETARRELEAAAPKLYAHWAEGRVEAVARLLAADDEREHTPWSHYYREARDLLGLPSEGEGNPDA